MFTLDTADTYGPSEAIIGQYMRLDPAAAHKTKVKLCNPAMLTQAVISCYADDLAHVVIFNNQSMGSNVAYWLLLN